MSDAGRSPGAYLDVASDLAHRTAIAEPLGAGTIMIVGGPAWSAGAVMHSRRATTRGGTGYDRSAR
ncbi:hypothetical protein [Actinomadura alba]|uniref:Uncharacterized protein n=1 Tax=Actinomadura alba TaxID=406431 RepID=A0ABR7LQ96_9ACTN|nr:hypothetical protein [Actinomadura alba]MBC6467018.1 hypothetical protein [Actinomadura alba]